MLEAKKFIENVENILKPQVAKQRVNVLYLNTACNLKCDYCYELEGRDNLNKQTKITIEQGREFFNEIMYREKNFVSTVVIMGGEALLEMGLLIHLLVYVKELDHQFAISVVTNGTQFHSLTETKKLKSLITTLEISYDGTGQDRRVTYGGISSRVLVENNLIMLRDSSIPFKISYTVHRDNLEHLLYDLVRIMEIYRPVEIKLSFACQELEDAGVDFNEYKNNFLVYAEQLYLSYGIAICDLSCALCRKCDKSTFEGNNYFSPTKGQLLEDSQTEHKFKSF